MPLTSRLPPAAQARICDDLSRIRGLTPDDVRRADPVCRGGRRPNRRPRSSRARHRTRGASRRPGEPDHWVDGAQGGDAQRAHGSISTPRAQRYEAAAAFAGTAIGGLVRLGDLDLRENDASGALDHYALASAAIRTQAAAADEIQMSDDLAGRLAQYVDNNRGIALLMTARTETDAPPDCVAFESECREAADAFAAAMAADPLNPVYTMNAAWVARLIGDADRSTALLDQALEMGIPLVAAANNDLGVLAAQRGDCRRRTGAFREGDRHRPRVRPRDLEPGRPRIARSRADDPRGPGTAREGDRAERRPAHQATDLPDRRARLPRRCQRHRARTRSGARHGGRRRGGRVRRHRDPRRDRPAHLGVGE